MSKARSVKFLFIAVFLWLGLVTLSRLGGPPSSLFDAAGATMQAALAAEQADGKPVLALVSADWCQPCQRLKSGALADKGVQQWVRENTHPALLDATDRASPNPHVARLKVYATPTLVMLRNGNETARLEGVPDARALLDWLSEHSGPVADWKAANPGKPVPAT